MNKLDISISHILRIEIDWLPIAHVFIIDVIRVRWYSLQTNSITRLIIYNGRGRYWNIGMTRDLVIPLGCILVVFLVLTTKYAFTNLQYYADDQSHRNVNSIGIFVLSQ